MSRGAFLKGVNSELPDVSIVVTVKNEEDNITCLLDSLKQLDYNGKIEVVVVDGGSVDKTKELVSQYDFVKLVSCPSNISKGRNVGINNSTGAIIAFTDADCIVDREWISNIMKYFEDYPEIGVIGGPYLPVQQDEMIAQYLGVYVSNYFPTEPGFSMPHSIGTGNAAYRRDLIEEVGLFNENLAVGEDLELNFRIAKAGYKLFFADDVRVYHKYRISFGEVTKWAFHHGKASSSYNRITKNYRKLLFPYTRSLMIVFGLLFLSSILLMNLALASVGLISLVGYYFYKLFRFKKNKYQPKIGLRTKFVLPFIDFYIRMLESIGSLIELLRI